MTETRYFILFMYLLATVYLTKVAYIRADLRLPLILFIIYAVAGIFFQVITIVRAEGITINIDVMTLNKMSLWLRASHLAIGIGVLYVLSGEKKT